MNKEVRDAIKWCKENHDGCSYITMRKTKQGDLCLVFGWDYDRKEVVMKLAINTDDLQCDYDIDWTMPFDDEEVWDTEMTAEVDSLDYMNKQAGLIAKAIERGEATVRPMDEKDAVIMKLKRLRGMIDAEEDLSYGELAFLQDHKKEIFDLDDIVLAEWAGIPEEEWNNGR